MLFDMTLVKFKDWCMYPAKAVQKFPVWVSIAFNFSDGLSYFLGKIPSFLNQNSTLHITSDYLVPLQILANTHLESNEMYKNAKILG